MGHGAGCGEIAGCVLMLMQKVLSRIDRRSPDRPWNELKEARHAPPFVVDMALVAGCNQRTLPTTGDQRQVKFHSCGNVCRFGRQMLRIPSAPPR